MGALEEDFEDNLDDIDESDLDEFLMNTEELQVKTSEPEKEEEDEENEISDAEEDCDAKNEENKEEDTDNTENKEEETKGETNERKEEKDTTEQSESSKWTFKGRSITSPQVSFHKYINVQILPPLHCWACFFSTIFCFIFWSCKIFSSLIFSSFIQGELFKDRATAMQCLLQRGDNIALDQVFIIFKLNQNNSEFSSTQ